MIKAAGQLKDGKPMLMLGITGENVARLVAGEPILIKREDMVALGCPELTLVIMYGKKEADIVVALHDQGLIDLRTELREFDGWDPQNTDERKST